MKILPAYALKSFSAIMCLFQTHFWGVLNGWVMTTRLLKTFLLINSWGCLCFHVFVSQKTDIIKLLNMDGRLLFVLLKSLHFSCQTHIETMARIPGWGLHVFTTRVSALPELFEHLYSQDSSCTFRVWIFFNSDFSCIPFCSLIFSLFFHSPFYNT